VIWRWWASGSVGPHRGRSTIQVSAATDVVPQAANTTRMHSRGLDKAIGSICRIAIAQRTGGYRRHVVAKPLRLGVSEGQASASNDVELAHVVHVSVIVSKFSVLGKPSRRDSRPAFVALVALASALSVGCASEVGDDSVEEESAGGESAISVRNTKVERIESGDAIDSAAAMTYPGSATRIEGDPFAFRIVSPTFEAKRGQLTAGFSSNITVFGKANVIVQAGQTDRIEVFPRMNGRLSVTASLSGSAKRSFAIQLGSLEFPLMVGIVPKTLKVDVTASCEAEAQGRADARVDVNFSIYNVRVANFPTSKPEFDSQISANVRTSPNVTGEARIVCSVAPEIKLLYLGLAGLALTPRAYVEAAYVRGNASATGIFVGYDVDRSWRIRSLWSSEPRDVAQGRTKVWPRT